MIENGYVGERAPGIDISILLPTRGRTHRLASAIGTLVDRAADRSRLELMVRIDNDDEASIRYFDSLAFTNLWKVGAQQINSGPRVGYARLFELYNDMALKARGRFVLLWNDDTDMVTEEWDRKLIVAVERYRPLVQFLRRDIYEQADTTLPFIDKRIVEALGGISRHMYTDTWIGEVAAAAGVLLWRNDVAYAHHWPQQDATMREGVEAIRQSGQHERFKAMKAEKEDDARKIRELLESLK